MSTDNNLSGAKIRLLIDVYQSHGHPNRKEALSMIVELVKSDLLRFCEVRCAKFNQPPEIAEDLVQRVLIKYAKKPSFDFAKSKGKTDYDSFLIYLCGIARFELTNIYREERRRLEGKWSDGSEQIITDLPSLPNGASPESKIRHKVISELSENHRVIYLTYTSYEREGCTLPRPLLKKLRDFTNLKQTAVQVFKHEAHQKIKAALDQYNFFKEL